MSAKWEAEYLPEFNKVAVDMGMNPYRGQGLRNRFDPGFGLDQRQQFQFGDLRVETDDRIVLVEMESGGGLTNLVKYWPLARQTTKPMILLHVFAQSSKHDYIAHHCLWDFTWGKMNQDLARTAPS